MPPRLISDEMPARLRALPTPPTELWVDGELDLAPPVIAIVGTRKSTIDAAVFALDLAAGCARAGAIVASGGAVGIDIAAHVGAVLAGGRTWIVAPTGYEHTYPPAHAPIFAALAARGATTIWPFPPTHPPSTPAFFARNRVLAALADVLVVVQAPLPSGSLNAASAARSQKKPVFVVSPPAWSRGFAGSRVELERGATPVYSVIGFLRAVGLAPPKASRTSKKSHLASAAQIPLPVRPARPLEPAEDAVFQALTSSPRHTDELSEKSHLPTHVVSTALLTLALENVVVEGPPGFFRRAEQSQVANIQYDSRAGNPRPPANCLGEPDG